MNTTALCTALECIFFPFFQCQLGCKVQVFSMSGATIVAFIHNNNEPNSLNVQWTHRFLRQIFLMYKCTQKWTLKLLWMTLIVCVCVFECVQEVWVALWVNKPAANNLPTDRKFHLPIILSLSLRLSLHSSLADYAVNTVRMRGADNWPAWINIS